jgi:hypothetical protein
MSIPLLHRNTTLAEACGGRMIYYVLVIFSWEVLPYYGIARRMTAILWYIRYPFYSCFAKIPDSFPSAKLLTAL